MLSLIEAEYLIETPLEPEKVASIIAGEQSSGTFVRVVETDELRERAAARTISVEELESLAAPTLASTWVEAKRLSGPFRRARLRIGFPTVTGNLYDLGEANGLRLLSLALPPDYRAGFDTPAAGAGGHEAADRRKGPALLRHHQAQCRPAHRSDRRSGRGRGPQLRYGEPELGRAFRPAGAATLDAADDPRPSQRLRRLVKAPAARYFPQPYQMLYRLIGVDHLHVHGIGGKVADDGEEVACRRAPAWKPLAGDDARELGKPCFRNRARGARQAEARSRRGAFPLRRAVSASRALGGPKAPPHARYPASIAAISALSAIG
jgi:hypothetical protein